jgi:hypothetical protein
MTNAQALKERQAEMTEEQVVIEEAAAVAIEEVAAATDAENKYK